VVQGSIFIELGLYNLFVGVRTVGTTRAQVDPVLMYDVWRDSQSRRSVNISEGCQTQQIRIRNGTFENT
jgi:hypothetical protein